MEFVFELLIELLFEGGLEISSNKKISKWIRYPIIIIIVLFFLAVILGIFALGIYLLKINVLLSLLIITLSFVMLVLGIKKFKLVYMNKKQRK